MSAEARGWGPGWPNCQRDKIVPLEVAGVSFPGGIRREVEPIFREFLREFHEHVEPLVPRGEGGWGNWGFACRPIGGTTRPSNHSWGLAADVNASKHPLGAVGTFTARQARTIRQLLGRYDGLLRWGGDYSGRKDEMHFEWLGSPQQAATYTDEKDWFAMATKDDLREAVRGVVRGEVRRELASQLAGLRRLARAAARGALMARREQLGLPPNPGGDGVWVDRFEAGHEEWADADRRLADKADKADG